MELPFFIQRLESSAETLRSLVVDLDPDQARWKPEPAKWSVLEVVNHLCDEEREDFRTRLDLTLHHPERSWPGINPVEWVTEREYNSRDLQESLENFLNERRYSLTWLRKLESPNWEQSYDHPSGKITAGDLLASWVAHDLLHIRQLAGLIYLDTVQRMRPYSTKYAGS